MWRILSRSSVTIRITALMLAILAPSLWNSTSEASEPNPVVLTVNVRGSSSHNNIAPTMIAQRQIPESNKPVALGAYIHGAPWNPTKIDEFTAMVGTDPKIVLWYQDWVFPGNREFDANKLSAVTERGAMPMVTWTPYDYTKGVNQPDFSLHKILDGTYDSYIREWAHGAARWKRTFYLRWAHEMNGTWYPWSAGVNSNTPAQYIASWRHIHDIFHEEGATNVIWVWSPNIKTGGSMPFEEVYPGDKYVDWIALDGYNWGQTYSWTRWESLTDIFGPSYDEITATWSKPLMIAEMGSADSGGDKAAWITEAFMTQMQQRFPRVRAVVWFNENKEAAWTVNSSQSALAAFVTVASHPVYQGRLPETTRE